MQSKKLVIAIITSAIILCVAAWWYTQNAEDVEQVRPQPEITLSSFTIPPEKTNEYVHFTEWPPHIELTHEAYTCVEGGDARQAGGVTYETTMGELDEQRTYCITEQREGAAGSEYITYTYRTAYDDVVMTLTMTMRKVQCLNYDQPQQDECLAAQFYQGSRIAVDETVQYIASSPFRE